MSALALAPALVAPIAVWVLGRVGWQGMFVWFSLPGLVMAGLMWLAMPRSPVTPASTSLASEEHGSLRGVIGQPSSWALFIAYMAFNVAFWGYLGWMPSYLALSRHIKLSQLGVYASVPYIFGFFGLLLFGWLGNKQLYRYRALLVAACYVMAAVALYCTFSAATVKGSVAGLSAAAFFLYGGFGPVWAIVLDMTPAASRGAFAGFVNCGGQIGGFFAPVIVGYLVSFTGSFTGGFMFMIAALAISAICFALLHPALQRRAQASVDVAARNG